MTLLVEFKINPFYVSGESAKEHLLFVNLVFSNSIMKNKLEFRVHKKSIFFIIILTLACVRVYSIYSKQNKKKILY